MQQKTSLLEWWWLISEKRCDGCAHSQEDDYNDALKAFLQYQKSKTLTLEDEKPIVLWSPFWVVWCINFSGA